ncbi:MAG TPA: hypothetical protein PLK94_09260 [Alphaproteobacteria bacterium]|nr:hypothetical protein [Alphaproteobacteria bacterium]HOO51459.1 hypothetical protein [Alphaproteobacteria bacterium]
MISVHPPFWRIAFPKTFPAVTEWKNDYESSQKLQRALNASLQHDFRSVSTDGKLQITIIYPHKLPRWIDGKPHHMVAPATQFLEQVGQALPQIDWRLAHGFYEKKNLNRSSTRKQKLINTLTTRQSHLLDQEDEVTRDILTSWQSREARRLFIIVDDVYCQGTTVANLFSAITDKGGQVLAAVSLKRSYHYSYDGYTYRLRQPDKPNWSLPETTNALEGTIYKFGRIPDLATLFRVQASYSPQTAHKSVIELLEDVEGQLHRFGLTYRTLTDGECAHFSPYIRGYNTMQKHVNGMGYHGFIKALENTPSPPPIINSLFALA